MAGRAANRVLVVALDAADRELVERWADSGELENIAAMRAQGLWSALDTTADVMHVSAWPSLYCGVPADRHGLYHAYVMRPGEQAPDRPDPGACPVPFLWKLLDEHGKRCIVVDAFLTCPLRDFSGIQIVDWGSWTWFSGTAMLPRGLAAEVKRRFGAYPAENHSKVGMTPPADPIGFRDRLLAGVEKKARLARWLADTRDWDFFFVMFGECHAAGHYFWHYQDPEHAAYAGDAEPRLRTALRDVHVALDRAVGELLELADERTRVLVVSGDGMGPNYSGSHLLAPLLERMGLLNAGGSGEHAAQRKDPARASALATLRGLVPTGVRSAVSRHVLPRAVNERLSRHWKTAGMDWCRTRAFPIENANEGFVRLNLAGREPKGIVRPGNEYEALCTLVAEAARGMTCPETGRPAAGAVHRTDDLFGGPCRATMPDVVVNWDPGARVTRELATAEHGVVRGPGAGFEVTPYYTGNHRPNAFLLGAGAGLGAGAAVDGASVLDFAPTMLACFGLEPPPHMQGRVLEALL